MVRFLIGVCLIAALASCNSGGNGATSGRTTTSTATATITPASPEALRAAGISTSALAKTLFGAKPNASSQPPAPYGGYSKGCLAGGAQLVETGPTWQAMRLSRNRNWGHPEVIDYIQRLSARVARETSWNGLYVGDISQPRGGPMLTGHRSHQIGLDVDIWMRPARNLGLSRTDRENISSISMRRAKGAFTNDDWTRDHHKVLRAAASDPRVARIFVFPGAKVRMCNDETGDRSYLRKIRPWYGHHYHFHVRLSCPPGATGCVNQAPIPPGDGCADAQQWVNDILNPPPPKPRDPNAPPPTPRREYVMADLPQQCAAVLTSR
jgi:penicillin-insensitive murein endopeptidase